MKQGQAVVLVTGAAGFVGKSVVARLIRGGYHVTALVRPTSDYQSLLHPQVNLVKADIRDEDWHSRVVGEVDCIVHLAATFSGAWQYFYEVNVKATENLLKFASRKKVRRFVYISSVSVYRHSDLRDGQTFTEDMSYEDDHFATYYAKSKIEAEKLVWKCHKDRHVPCVVLRPGAIYGPEGDIFPATLGLKLGDDRIMLIGNRSSKLPLSYVDKVAEIVARSLLSDQAVGQCFNLVEDRTLSRKEYLRRLKSGVDRRISFIWLPLWAMRLLRFFSSKAFEFIGRKGPLSALNLKLYCTTLLYSTTKAKECFGDVPYVDLETSLNKTMAWHRQTREPRRPHVLKKLPDRDFSQAKLRVGIVGCGRIAPVHLGSLREIGEVDTIVISDPSKEARDAVSRQFQIARQYADYHEMLEKEKLDVVHILTPPQLHAEVAVAAAKRGCHLLVEKPMAVDAAQAQTIVRAADDAKVKLCVVHHFLFDEGMIKARELVARGKLGRITFVESWYGAQLSPDDPVISSAGFWGHSLPGLLFHDYLPHALYVLTDIIGAVNVEHVATRGVSGLPSETGDELKVLLGNDSALGMISLSLASSPRYQFLKIYGTRGALKVDFLNKSVFLDKEIGPLPKTLNRNLSALRESALLGTSALRNNWAFLRGRFSLFSGTNRLIKLFYQSLMLDEPVPVPGIEGWESMKVMDDVWRKLDVRGN